VRFIFNSHEINCRRDLLTVTHASTSLPSLIESGDLQPACRHLPGPRETERHRLARPFAAAGTTCGDLELRGSPIRFRSQVPEEIGSQDECGWCCSSDDRAKKIYEREAISVRLRFHKLQGTNDMLRRPRKIYFRKAKVAACAIAFSLFAVGTGPVAAASGPFAALAGSWSGEGTVMVSNGTNEHLRCRATYRVESQGQDVDLNLRCASDSYNFNLLSTVRYESGSISGSWSETTHNASGSLSGRANGRQILVSARGGSFAANLLLVTHDNRQSVSIRATGADVTGADIMLSRR
jgi:hypothetical protein